jgi:hypothetical protein
MSFDNHIQAPTMFFAMIIWNYEIIFSRFQDLVFSFSTWFALLQKAEPQTPAYETVKL